MDFEVTSNSIFIIKTMIYVRTNTVARYAIPQWEWHRWWDIVSQMGPVEWIQNLIAKVWKRILTLVSNMKNNLFKYESLSNVIIAKYYLLQDVRTIFITAGVSRTRVMILLLILPTRLFSCGSRAFARKHVEFVKQVGRKGYLMHWTNIYSVMVLIRSNWLQTSIFYRHLTIPTSRLNGATSR